MTVTRIGILGAGAVGSALGGMLEHSGHEVRFIGKKGSVADPGPMRIGLPGILITAGGIRGKAGGRGTVGALPDFLIVCLGRHHLRALKKEALKPLMDPERTRVVFCNADPEEARRLDIPLPRVSFMLVLLDAVKLQERDVEVCSRNPCIVCGKGSPETVFEPDLNRFGIAVHAVEDVRRCHNSLFVSELLFLPVALCNTTLMHFLSFASGRKIARAVLAEGLKTMEKCGKSLARLPVMDPRTLADRIAKNPSGLDASRFLPDRAFPPILQSFTRGVPGEARELNKRIVEMGASAGLELPLNWKLYQKAGRPAGVGYYRNPDELENALA